MNNGKIKTIGSNGIINGDKMSLTDEQREEVRRLAEKEIRKKMNTPFKQVCEKIKNGQTLQDIIQEVHDKKSNMTRFAREFVVNFKQEIIQKWINDELNPYKVEDAKIEEENTNG